MAKPKDPVTPATPETPANPPTPETSAPETAQESSFVSKLSIKALGCDPRLAKGVNAQVLCRIFGMAQGLKHGEDKNSGNLWTALQGSFEGINAQEDSDDFGKVLRSGKLFLPAGIQDVVEGAVRQIENSAGGAETAAVTFALEIRSVKAANPIGYSYEARSLTPTVKTDPLTEMRNMIEQHAGKVVKQIAAPAPVPQTS